MSFVFPSLQDCYEVVQKTTLVILQRLQHVLQMEVSSNCVIIVLRTGNIFFTKCGWGAFLLCYMQNLHLEALVLLLKFIKMFFHSFSRKVYQTEHSIMTYNLSYVPHYRYADISEWLNSDIFIILKFIQWHLKLDNPWHINPFVLLCPVICFQHWSSMFQSSQNLFKDE